jgi:hypothetical protein
MTDLANGVAKPLATLHNWLHETVCPHLDRRTDAAEKRTQNAQGNHGSVKDDHTQASDQVPHILHEWSEHMIKQEIN